MCISKNGCSCVMVLATDLFYNMILRVNLNMIISSMQRTPETTITCWQSLSDIAERLTRNH